MKIFGRRGPRKVVAAKSDWDREFDFSKLAAHCHTQNEFNHLTITLENTLAPAEIASIAELDLPSPTNERSRIWLQKLGKWEPEIFRSPQKYEKEMLFPGTILYEDRAARSQDKGLLLAFCGNAERLMMPICVFLQTLESSLWSVVVVRKSRSTSYVSGIKEIADDFPGVVQIIASKLHSSRYQRVLTLGTSSGGFFAIWAAALLAAQRGISVSGFLPRHLPEHVAAADSSDLRIFFGEMCARDFERALAIQKLFGGKLWPVPGVASHNVFDPIMRQGTLRQFFQVMLA